jgi:hypothetical protein
MTALMGSTDPLCRTLQPEEIRWERGLKISPRPSHRRASHRRASHRGHLIGMSLIGVPLTGVHLRGVHLSYACLSHRPSHRRASHRRASPIDYCLVGVFLIGGPLIDVLLTGPSHRRLFS